MLLHIFTKDIVTLLLLDCFELFEHITGGPDFFEKQYVTPEPLEISSGNFQDIILWSKGRTNSQMAIYSASQIKSP